MLIVASNTETGSSESTRARWPTTIEYENSIKRIDEPRVQKRPPLLVASTEVRALNATAMLPPNPTVTGSVIGEQAPIKSSLFPTLSQRLDKGTTRHSAAGVISHCGTPRDAQSQHSHVTRTLEPPDPQADTFLPS